MPTCRRCLSSGAQCQYLPSRRGLKRRAIYDDEPPRITRSPPQSTPDITNGSRTADSPSIPWEGRPDDVETQYPRDSNFVPPRPSRGPFDRDNMTGGASFSLPTKPAQPPVPNFTPVSPESAQRAPNVVVEDDEVLTNLYYANFHAAHPVLVPRSLYASQEYPAYLKMVVHFVGSHFSDTASSDLLYTLTADLLSRAERTSPPAITYHLVQAKLILSIALHARNEIPHSTTVLAQAVSLALEMGMHRKTFSTERGRRSPVEEESIRRTWWELYVIDGLMAALQRKHSFRCHESSPDVLLPSDDFLYAERSTSIPEPRTLAQFDSRIFMDDEARFSSFSYRIEAMRLLARVLAIAWTHDLHEDHPHHIDAAKANVANAAGSGEYEMLFQAHMLIQFSVMYLHFPRSDLVATVPGATRVIRQQHVPPVSTRNIHGLKALVASKQMSKLATVQFPVQKHTPFFLCGVAFAALVQLSACSLRRVYMYGPLEQYRDRISLTIGILKTLGPTTYEYPPRC
ncbi:fungal-specific transcription factor domain-containing protein [Aspergillus varians]